MDIIQEDKLNKLIACMNGKQEFVLGYEDYSFEGMFHKEFTEAKNTKIYVSGTITNDTNESWDMVTVAIGIVDENGDPKKVSSYDEFPILYASVNNVEPKETVTFKTNIYPGVIEADYEGLVDYKLLGVKETRFIEE